MPIGSNINVSIPDDINSYTLDGVTRPAITLRKGYSTQFIMDSTTTNHPFRLFTRPNDVTSVYTSGVTLQSDGAGSSGRLTIIPTDTVPPMLYYGSLSGANMGYSIVFA